MKYPYAQGQYSPDDVEYPTVQPIGKGKYKGLEKIAGVLYEVIYEDVTEKVLQSCNKSPATSAETNYRPPQEEE